MWRARKRHRPTLHERQRKLALQVAVNTKAYNRRRALELAEALSNAPQSSNGKRRSKKDVEWLPLSEDKPRLPKQTPKPDKRPDWELPLCYLVTAAWLVLVLIGQYLGW
jgi:hypothetical protein